MWHNIRNDFINKFKFSLLQMIWLCRLKAQDIFGLTSPSVPVTLQGVSLYFARNRLIGQST